MAHAKVFIAEGSVEEVTAALAKYHAGATTVAAPAPPASLPNCLRLLRTVLRDTENVGSVRTTTLVEIRQLIDQVDGKGKA